METCCIQLNIRTNDVSCTRLEPPNPLASCIFSVIRVIPACTAERKNKTRPCCCTDPSRVLWHSQTQPNHHKNLSPPSLPSQHEKNQLPVPLSASTLLFSLMKIVKLPHKSNSKFINALQLQCNSCSTQDLPECYFSVCQVIFYRYVRAVVNCWRLFRTMVFTRENELSKKIFVRRRFKRDQYQVTQKEKYWRNARLWRSSFSSILWLAPEPNQLFLF